MINFAKNLSDKGLQYWLLNYIWQSIKSNRNCTVDGPIHVILCIVDHFEPFTGGVGFERAQFRINSWVERYSRLGNIHKDADNRKPQHTWFYPPHHDQSFLSDLVKLCAEGLGEIEMHLHHNHMRPFPDTSRSLKKKIMTCIEAYSRHGIFCSIDGRKNFGFIHGDWSLDNSGGDHICGVNDEISILRDCGCYADFTFPSLGRTQPRMINKIYYATDNTRKPKSYDTGKELVAGRQESGDLLMIPGIIGLRWHSRARLFKLSIESSNLDKHDIPTERRINYWVRNGLTIKGGPRWEFIKLHTHGAREDTWDVLLGKDADNMFSYFESKFNNNCDYVLHYVTAREMYNIIKAAEAGCKGDPNSYRDYIIKPYIYSR